MTIDPDEAVERDDLAPTQRLHIIAALLAEGVRRKHADPAGETKLGVRVRSGSDLCFTAVPERQSWVPDSNQPFLWTARTCREQK